ncbi:MAG TPA: ABC transporter permease [Tepidiformaceae bacterium]|nr:ABC transporter permease [Tepidiformaceae bacterium]
MNRVIIEVTLRQIAGRRRSIFMSLFALVPVAIALLYQVGNGSAPAQEFTPNILRLLVVAVLMPLVALVLGTAALGSEIEDGTAVYLLAKPIPRWVSVLSKFVVTSALTALLVVASTTATGVIGMGGFDDTRIVLGFAVAVAVGSVVYSAVFILLSVITSRALIVGLIYVFLWEGVITNIFSGTRVASVRSYTLGIADTITTVSARYFEADLSGRTAIILAVAVTAIALWYAGQRLKRFEIGETA